ncbi:MAG: hypothetical protein F6K42_19575 [Leptolyngbya sp. SIO1D8]|nr:hypothetical protein [Leptolyngbya sp. SIO1D8]
MRTMLIQDTWDRFASTFVQVPVLRNFYRKEQSWCLLPTSYLNNFEPVINQFAPFGLKFEGAIALYPSNPRFSKSDCLVTIGSVGHCKSLKITLEKSVRQLHFWLVGSESITISALNTQGHCVAAAHTNIAPAYDLDQPCPRQEVTINTRAASVIRIDSKAPFVLTRCAVKQVHPPSQADEQQADYP